MTLTPLTAPYKLSQMYTVDGLHHVSDLYCSATLISGVYHMVNNDSTTTNTVAADSEYWFTELATAWPSDLATFDGYVLYHEVSGDSIPVESSASAVTPTGTAGVYTKAGYATLSMKTPTNDRIRFVLSETAEIAPRRWVTRSSMPAVLQNWHDIITSVALSADSHAPVNWLRSRGNNPAGNFRAIVVTLSNRIRSRRGLK